MKIKIKKILFIIKNHFFSMRFLTIIIIILSVVIPAGILKNIIVDSMAKKQVVNLQTELQNRCNLLATDIVKSGYMLTHKDDKIDAQLEQITYTYSGRVVIVALNYSVIKDTYVERENKFLVSAEVNKAFRGIYTKVYVQEYGYIKIVSPIFDTSGKNIVGVISITVPDTNIKATKEYLSKMLTIMGQITALIIALIAVIFAFLITIPLKKLTMTIKSITSGYMDERLEERKGLGEIVNLSAEVNKMLDRLKALDESRQEFVSNVSHELKTPITSIKVLADSLNGQTDVPVELYQEFMSDIVEEIDRENKIINDLLSLVKLDKTAAGLNLAPQNMNEVVEHVLKRLKPLAEENDIELVLESFRPVVAEIDEVKISLVITNLVENAIKYNVANGWVRVSVNADYKNCYLTVSDSGIGIPDDCREKIFERFYRVDKARSRQTGGTGLGLAITQNAILMHNGEIKVYSKEGEGSTFTVRIPLTNKNSV